MRNLRITRHLVSVALLLCGFVSPLAAQQDAAADRIRRQVTAIAAGDSITHRRAAIEARLRSIGLEPRLVWFDPAAGRGGRRGANIVAEIPGPTNEVLLLGAHYDRVSEGRGVIDNAAGAATVLELAEAFKSRPLSHYTVRVALFDLEEFGLLGSHAMVADSLNTPLPPIFLNFDVFGYGQTFWIGATDANRPVPRALQQAAQSGGLRIVIDSFYPPSDHLSFRGTRTESYGISILDAKDIDLMLSGMRGGGAGFNPDSIRIMNIIHTPGDSLDKLDAAAVSRAVRIVERAIRALDRARRR